MLLFSIMASWTAAIGMVFLVAAVVAQTSFRMQKAAAMVIPGAALLWFALAAFLLLLGLVGEVAVPRSFRSRNAPLAREVK
jgi:Na+/alanine symporter